MALLLLCSPPSLFRRVPLRRRESEPRPDRAGGGGGRCRTTAPGPGNAHKWYLCAEIKTRLPFRCFPPDMNIQRPYWNLIWVSLSLGSFHQCLLPEATADWQPNFSKEQAGGKKGGRGEGGCLEMWAAWSRGGSWNRWVDGCGGVDLTSLCACTNRILQIINREGTMEMRDV